MAIYEYKCNKCKYIFEEDHKMSYNSNTTKCPICKSESKKQISISSFVINGYCANNGYSK